MRNDGVGRLGIISPRADATDSRAVNRSSPNTSMLLLMTIGVRATTSLQLSRFQSFPSIPRNHGACSH